MAKVGLSAKFGVVTFKASILDSQGGCPSAKVGSSAKFGVVVFKASILNSLGGSIGQSRFICQFLVYWYSRHLCFITWVGPSAKVGLSAKFGVVEFKASILDSPGECPSAKVGSSAKFGVAVFKASILDSLGGPLAKVDSSANFWCTGIQGISASLPGWVHQPK